MKMCRIFENFVELYENPLISHPLLAYISYFPMSIDLRELIHKLF
jgi:hypothetical protein